MHTCHSGTPIILKFIIKKSKRHQKYQEINLTSLFMSLYKVSIFQIKTLKSQRFKAELREPFLLLPSKVLWVIEYAYK